MRSIRNFSLLIAALAIAVAAPAAHAQSNSAYIDKNASTQIGAASAVPCTGTNNPDANSVMMQSTGFATGGFTVTGTWSGTLKFAGAVKGGGATSDPLNWVPLPVVAQTGGNAITSTTTNGTWFTNTAGYRFVCVYFSAYSSGAAVVTENLSLRERADLVGPRGTPINCTVAVSAGVAIAPVGGSCLAPGGGLSIYVTDISFGSSAASGTTADSFPTLKQATASTSCATAPVVVWQGLSVANTTITEHEVIPIKLTANTDLCWVMTTAGSKTIQIQGFIAP
jgi:hypothetical protein